MVSVKNILLYSSMVLFTCSPIQQVFSGPLLAEAYESRRVERIDIQAENLPSGTSFDARPVLEKLQTKVGTPFSQLVFDSDLKSLASSYDRIEPQIDVNGGEVFITIKVWLRPTIRKITWQGNAHIKNSALRKELGIKPTKTYNRVEFNKKFNKVKEYYVKKGYFESQLSYVIVPVADSNEVDIEITVVEGRAGIIDDIIFSGFSNKEKSKILEMIYTKEYNFFTSWLTGHGVFHEEAIEQDRLTVVNLLQNEGYADAKVDLQITNAEKEGRIVVTITADKGPIFHYGEVTFRGNTLFTDKEIENAFLIHPNEAYSPEKIRNTADSIKDLYGRKGYIETNVQYETELASDAPVYNVHFDIEEGAAYKIGLIRVFGNEQTQVHVILRESLLTPGETFDSVKLKATQQRLQNMGYFKNVNVYAVRTQDDQILGENYRDVYIEVEEAPTGHASLFFGYSNSDKIFGGLDITETNFNYKGFKRLPKDGPSAMRGGGEYAHAKVTIGSSVRTYLISWMTPYFRDTLWRVGFEGYVNQSQLEAKDYQIDSLGGSLFASYPLSAYWTAGTKYRAKHAKIDVAHGVSRSEKHAKDGTGNISAISGSLNYDSTDSMIKPHNGLRSYLEAEFSGLAGDFYFFKYSYVNSFYQELWPHGIMKYRWEARFLQPIWKTASAEKISLSERFFLGGENSVRGFKPFNMGPHYKKKSHTKKTKKGKDADSDKDSNDPKGGISYTVMSVEYLHELLKIVDGFVFVDAGTISMKKFNLPRIQMTYGAGLRIEVMNRMPITVGFGIPVNLQNKRKNQEEIFYFSMGGQF
jgi:outer membrane protein insertion porin family